MICSHSVATETKSFSLCDLLMQGSDRILRRLWSQMTAPEHRNHLFRFFCNLYSPRINRKMRSLLAAKQPQQITQMLLQII